MRSRRGRDSGELRTRLTSEDDLVSAGDDQGWWFGDSTGLGGLRRDRSEVRRRIFLWNLKGWFRKGLCG